MSFISFSTGGVWRRPSGGWDSAINIVRLDKMKSGLINMLIAKLITVNIGPHHPRCVRAVNVTSSTVKKKKKKNHIMWTCSHKLAVLNSVSAHVQLLTSFRLDPLCTAAITADVTSEKSHFFSLTLALFLPYDKNNSSLFQPLCVTFPFSSAGLAIKSRRRKNCAKIDLVYKRSTASEPDERCPLKLICMYGERRGSPQQWKHNQTAERLLKSEQIVT